MKTLRELYSEHDGKVSDKWDIYLNEYDRFLEPYRNEKLNLLEIGVQNGGSLEIWQKYFPNANVLVGCDINEDCSKLEYDSEKVRVIVGDANTDDTEKQILSINKRFDVIIDDGSHTSEDIVRSFARYFPHLEYGGVFIAEDLHCSYWNVYGGGLYDLSSSINFFKSLVDVVNYEHWGLNRSAIEVVAAFNERYGISFSLELLSEIHSVEFINSVCVIRKHPSENNRLGRRNIVGQTALVVPGLNEFNGYSQAIPQDESNENSIHPVTQIKRRDEKIETLSEKTSALAEKVSMYEEQVAAFQSKVRSDELELDQLRNSLSETITTMHASFSWRITSPIRVASNIARTYLSSPAAFKRGVRKVGRKIIRSRRRVSEAACRLNPYGHETAEQGGAEISLSNYRVDKLTSFERGDDVLVYVAYAPKGALSELHIKQINLYSDSGYKVCLIVNSGDYYSEVDPGPSRALCQIVRENVGYDFGGWKVFLESVGGIERVNSLTLTNDSVVSLVDEEVLRAQREEINNQPSDVVFLTKNYEIKEHCQSYFYSLKRSALASGGAEVITAIPFYKNKDALISEVEIELGSLFSSKNITSSVLYEVAEAESNRLNPTIHYWKELLDKGFPFFKLQLLSSNILDTSHPDFVERVDPLARGDISRHLQGRAVKPIDFKGSLRFSERALQADGLFDAAGVQQAFNPAPHTLGAIVVPLEGVEAAAILTPRVLVVIHCFYVDIADELLSELASLGFDFKYLLTTNADNKKAALDNLLSRYNLSGDVVVCPNQGRDVAPFLVESASYLREADLLLHLHTKKSPHNSAYASWGEYLRKNLVGSREIVNSIFHLFEDKKVGVIYSEHYPEVERLRNWGFDFDHAKAILNKVGVDIDASTLLEFPTGTMFWSRVDALSPLFNLGLQYSDFGEEAGQLDGTLAHSIERSLLYVSESRGYVNVKVISGAQKQKENVSMKLSVADIPYYLKRRYAQLLGSVGSTSKFYSAVGEIYPVNCNRSPSKRTRVNILLPTMKPEKIYGGITTAVHVAKELLADARKDLDVRVIVTSDSVNKASIEEVTKRLGNTYFKVAPNEDVEGFTIVPLAEKRHIPLSLRENDIFFATAWWTADLGFRLKDKQRACFEKQHPMLYLIQDFEPGFYPWSNKYALSFATYSRSLDTIALINSEELFNFMRDKFSFSQAYCLPYKLNENIASLLKPTTKAKKIIVYGRPSVDRNCFELIVEGIRLWQSRDPLKNTQYQVVFAGEDFSESLISELENCHVAGKLPLDHYADLLNSSAMGISLMVSPHPSYPPLEMAKAGCITITNTYENKNLSERAPNILSLNALVPDSVADKLDEAVVLVNTRTVTDLPDFVPVKINDGILVDYVDVWSRFII